MMQLHSSCGFRHILMLCLLACCGCNVSGVLLGQVTNRVKIQGSGVEDIEERDVAKFSKINVGSAFHLNVIVGKKQQVTVTADDNILPLIETTVKGDTLHLGVQSGTSISTKSNMEVTITVKELTSLNSSGAAHVAIAGLACDKFSLDASGASQNELVGTVENFRVDASGAAKLDASSVDAAEIKVSASGAAKVKLYSTNSVKGDASGAASVTISGTPDSTKVNRSGAAKVRVVTSEE